jgi:hypothetical protein
MLYAALTFWILVILFAAWGTHSLWSGLIRPRVVNSILLPGTLIAQLGHVLGLLITGGTVQNTTLMGDDENGEPRAETPEDTRVPVLGPVIVGLLPLVACATALYVAARWWGQSVVASHAERFGLPQQLPTTLAGAWDLLRQAISLTESVLAAIVSANLLHWPTLLFIYLAICLTVRMGPFQGNQRGALAAAVLAGGLIALLGTLLQPARDLIHSSWPILSFAVGMLLLLLLLSLIVRGVIGLVKILASGR